jgi:DNA-binding beta-propeller fold protein YncE
VVAALLAAAVVACGGEGDGEGRVYLGSGMTDRVFVLDARDGHVVDTLPLDPRLGETDEPHGLAVAPDGRHWYATLSHGEPTLWKFESDGDRLVGRLRLGVPGAARIGITPDGARAFIPDYWRTGQGAPSQVSVVSLHDLVEEATLTLCPAPHDAVVHPAGRLVGITCSLSDEVVVMDGATLEVLSRFTVDAQPGPAGQPRFKPLNLVWIRGGDALLVTLASAHEVRAFTTDGRPEGSVAVGDMPTQLALTPGGSTAVVVNRLGGSLTLVDVPTLTERARIPLPDAPNPHGVALGAEGRVAFVSFEGTVESAGGAVAVDLATGEILWRTEAGSYTLGVAFRPPR